jgi:succinate dehydrogenase / fumarate reductase flavoprotein subunit
MSTIEGLFVLGEANFSDHGANRLGASALMQGLADGYFVIPYTIGHYFATAKTEKVTTDHPEFKKAEEDVRGRIGKLLSLKGARTVVSIHRELGTIMWEYVGMARNEAGLKKALELIPRLREEFWSNAKVVGDGESVNHALERAGRVADFLEFAELICHDALNRNESCGGHFREEYQTEDGEALRNDDDYAYVAAWEYTGVGSEPILHKEPLEFENVKLQTRSYK